MNFRDLCYTLFLLFSLTSKSAVYTATACPATWGTSPYPFWNGSTQLTSGNITAGDVLVIPLGCSVSISGNITMAVDITLTINGALAFPTSGDKLNLTANSSIVASNTGSLVGVSNSNQIRIGSGAAEWSGPGTLGGPFIISNGFLPVEFIAFTGNLEVKVVFIKWKTATELNNDYYDVEKSNDGTNFQQFRRVKSKAINGASNSVLDYTAVDNDLKHPLYYYRLKQVDFDGTSKYSSVISVKVYSPELKIYPNPSNGQFWIDVPTAQVNQQLSIKIYDNLSQNLVNSNYTVVNDNITGAKVEISPSSPLPKGVYLSVITFNGFEYRLKLVIN